MKITPYVDRLSAKVFKMCWNGWVEAPATVEDGEILVALTEAVASAQAALDQFKLSSRDRLPAIEAEATAIREKAGQK